ncbi:MAG: RIP metalloprotease RseP [Dictyoglomus thermophilum]
MELILFLILFGLLTIPHEFGHFIFAKIFGVKVYEYAIGFGPKILEIKGKETRFVLRLIPIGGFVKMAGVDDINLPEFEEVPENRRFYRKAPWQRFLILFAGSFMNFVFAIILFISIFLIGIPQPIPVVDKVLENKPASMAGIMPGDRLLYINGQKIEDISDAVRLITGSIKAPGEEKFIEVTLERDGNILTFRVKPEWSEERKGGVIGIVFKTVPKKYSLPASVKNGILMFVNALLLIFYVFKALFSGAQGVSITGPIGIAKMTGEVASMGLIYYLNFIALLSVQIGIFNLLPIPALDGGRILFIIIEKIRGKPIETSKEEIIHWVGFLILLFLMLLVTFFDILNLRK